MALRLDERTGAIVAAHTDAPAGSRVLVDRSQPDRITIRIPHSRRVRWVFQAVFYLALVVVLLHVLLQASEGRIVFDVVTTLASLLGLLLTNLHARFGGTRLCVGTEKFSVTKSLFGIRWRRGGRTSRIASIALRDISKSREDTTPLRYTVAVAIQTGFQNYNFGFFLSPEEKTWIARELRIFLREIGHPVD